MNAHSDGQRVIVEGVRYPHVGLFPAAKPGEAEPRAGAGPA